MKLLKINNLININPLFNINGGTCDYKGLDIEQFMPGSQVYPIFDNFCLVATIQDNYIHNSDIEELTEEQYKTLKTEIERKNVDARPKSEEQVNAQRISELENLLLQGQGVV